VTLSQLIGQYAAVEFENGDDEGVVAKLNELSIVSYDNDMYTWAGIALTAGPEAAESLRVALEQNGMGWVVHQFGGTGLQLTNPLVRQAIEGFIQAGLPLQPLIDVTESRTSPAQSSLGRAATLADIAQYRLDLFKRGLEDAAMDRLQAYREALSAWDGSGEGPVL
jgi:hypothetical protein